MVGDHFQTDIMVFVIGLKTGTARVDSSSFFWVGYVWWHTQVLITCIYLNVYLVST